MAYPSLVANPILTLTATAAAQRMQWAGVHDPHDPKQLYLTATSPCRGQERALLTEEALALALAAAIMEGTNPGIKASGQLGRGPATSSPACTWTRPPVGHPGPRAQLQAGWPGRGPDHVRHMSAASVRPARLEDRSARPRAGPAIEGAAQAGPNSSSNSGSFPEAASICLVLGLDLPDCLVSQQFQFLSAELGVLANV